MRKNRHGSEKSEFSILALDDDPIMTATIQSYFQGAGYQVDVENDPVAAIERVRTCHYDILLLDFLMTPLCGDQVVEQIRTFNHDLFIILLTGHKSMAPPIRTIRALDIQGYYEKNDRFDQLELLVESCVKSIRQMRLIRSYQQRLADMASIMPEIYALQEPNQIGSHILAEVQSLWACTDGLLAIWDGGRGAPHLRFSSGDAMAGLDAETPELLCTQVEQQFGRERVLCSPVANSLGESVGVLAIVMAGKPDFYQEQLFRIFVRQCAASMENTLLLRRVKDSYVEVIKALRLMVDAKDIYTRGHSDRVSYYAGHLAAALGKDPETCRQVRLAGLFHDVGKMAIPDNILLSPDKLTDEEFEVIRKHPECGSSILSAISSFRTIAPIVRSHHERIDGKGYPDGLSGTDIPEASRIISIADTFDAMTSARRYRPSMTFDQALEKLVEVKDTQLDGKMVDVFLNVIRELPEEIRQMEPGEQLRFFAEEVF